MGGAAELRGALTATGLPAEPPAAPAGPDMTNKIEQLKQLGELKNQGVLTEAEFEEQKRTILGS